MEQQQKNEVFWEWEQKKDAWVRYDASLTKKLTDAAELKRASVDLVEKSAKLNLAVDFQTMIQKNKATGFQKKIRCSLAAADGTNIIIFLIFLVVSFLQIK